MKALGVMGGFAIRSRSIVVVIVLLTIAGLCISNTFCGKPGDAFVANEPGGTADAVQLALQDPDEFAWQLFLFLNQQAMPGIAGKPDPLQRGLIHYDSDKAVVWETWALASDSDPGGSSEVFLPKGAKPVNWSELKRGDQPAKTLDINLKGSVAQNTDQRSDNGASNLRKLLTASPPDARQLEVRFNESAFNTVRDKGLHSREGLIAAFTEAAGTGNRDFIQFGSMAKVIKAGWREITDGEKPRYHWRTIGGTPYGLVAFHITTKDLPLWFWSDFIHVDLEKCPAGSIVCEPADVDSTTRGPNAKHGKDGVRDETAGSKWSNYRLKGSQVAFFNAIGQATTLGNQMLEKGNAAKSSCITCHAMAGIKEDGTANPSIFLTGAPDRSKFGDDKVIKLLQTDFLFSIAMRAHSTKE